MENNILFGLKEDGHLTQDDVFAFFLKLLEVFKPNSVILEARNEKREEEEVINDHSFMIPLPLDDLNVSSHFFHLYSDLNDYILHLDEEYIFMAALLKDTKFLGIKKVNGNITATEESKIVSIVTEVLQGQEYSVQHLKNI